MVVMFFDSFFLMNELRDVSGGLCVAKSRFSVNGGDAARFSYLLIQENVI